ncbi:PREDICTED: sn1-specific diacylglycerol lipase alpha [Myotis davidii]|uniref:sn1-specific diacylglycerol lipase alpha n=1 Tax=Myotis davidii TaxID=225400 RepID=UPI000767DE84|nr:PREDICTED: sn1-specific diacylglycerol lipase alpha [Myotis davidii]
MTPSLPEKIDRQPARERVDAAGPAPRAMRLRERERADPSAGSLGHFLQMKSHPHGEQTRIVKRRGIQRKDAFQALKNSSPETCPSDTRVRRFVILSVVLFGLVYNPHEACSLNLVDHGRGYLGILLSCMIAEMAIIWLSMRGGILYTEPRESMQYVLYVRLAILVIEFIYAIVGIVWLTQYYTSCNDLTAKNGEFSFRESGSCGSPWPFSFQCRREGREAGDSQSLDLWSSLKEYGASLHFSLGPGSAGPAPWPHTHSPPCRHRLEEGQATSWSRRLKVFLCCTRTKDSAARWRRVVAGAPFGPFSAACRAGCRAPFLRAGPRSRLHTPVFQANNDILAFLSGMPVTRNTKYLDLKNSVSQSLPTQRLLPLALPPRCFLCPSRPRFAPGVTIEEDNCCGCNAIAIRRHFLDENLTAVDIAHEPPSYQVYETPFYVAVDHDKKKVVISIRGTLSPKDALTDLTGDAERLPVEGHHGTWLGHKGMVLSAEYIKKKLEQEMVLSQAFGRDLGRGTKHYGLIVVGHSLGAGTAAILSFLLRPQYPTLKCFAYSPPGGLLSEDAMEYSKEFVTAVVLGKDLVPRIGLSQLEGFRRQLLDVLQRSTKPKWRIIVGATKCIPKSELPEEAEVTAMANTRLWTHPSDLTIALSASTPLYPPGRIIHVVHNHPAEQCCCCEQEEPTYFAIWGDNKAFNEVIISPAMLHEHLPYVVMEGLNKVRLGTGGPSAAAPPAGSAAPDCRRGCGCSEGLAAPPGGLGGAESRLVSWSLHPALSRGRVARDHRNSCARSKSQSEMSLEGFSEGRLLSPVAAFPKKGRIGKVGITKRGLLLKISKPTMSAGDATHGETKQEEQRGNQTAFASGS